MWRHPVYGRDPARWIQGLIRLAGCLPGACLLCQAPLAGTQGLCAGCQADLPVVRQPCPCCGLPSVSSVLPCGACQKQVPPWDACLSACAYTGTVPGLMHRFKDGRQRLAGHVLSDRLLERLRSRPAMPDAPALILPVPLHRYRLWRRGFNPALLVARRLGAALNLPVDERSLQRSRPTPHQQGLSAAARRRNLRAAFVVRPGLPSSLALVDDVVTTGSTVAEISRLLKRHGVQRVEVWCLARTLKLGEL